MSLTATSLSDVAVWALCGVLGAGVRFIAEGLPLMHRTGTIRGAPVGWRSWTGPALVAFLGGIVLAVAAGSTSSTDPDWTHTVLAAVLFGYVVGDLTHRVQLMLGRPEEPAHAGLGDQTWQDAAPAPARVQVSLSERAKEAASREADPRAVGMFFVTTRQPMDAFSEGWYSGERADEMSFGKAFVRIPEAHRMGSVELPMKIKLLSLELYEATRNPQKHFVIRAVETLDRDRWCELVGAFPAEEALVFAHGFNTSFEESLYRNAQILWDLQYRGVSVVFSWPSRGHAKDYGYDRNSALGARAAFIRVLELLKSQPNIKRIHILAHSMGNLVALEALASHRHDLSPLGLGELMLAAPDVDRDHFRGIAPEVRKWTSGMTLYASSADKALAASKMIAGSIPRAGDVPADGPIVIPGMESIDVTAIGDEILGLNHSTYAQARSVLNDVGLLLRAGTRPPHLRLSEIRGVPEGATTPLYWRYSI